jgi:hypothetical protein
MVKRVASVAALFVLAVPTPALAASDEVPSVLAMGVGIVALLLAALLLVIVVGLRRVAEGAAIAQNVTYVVLGVLCLVAAILAGWVVRFIPGDMSVERARVAADILIIAAMVLFGVYFNSVRKALLSFLRGVRGDEALARSQGKDGEV